MDKTPDWIMELPYNRKYKNKGNNNIKKREKENIKNKVR